MNKKKNRGFGPCRWYQSAWHVLKPSICSPWRLWFLRLFVESWTLWHPSRLRTRKEVTFINLCLYYYCCCYFAYFFPFFFYGKDLIFLLIFFAGVGNTLVVILSSRFSNFLVGLFGGKVGSLRNFGLGFFGGSNLSHDLLSFSLLFFSFVWRIKNGRTWDWVLVSLFLISGNT